jgi:HK97 family phage major capsid protein/HK97 family phage prohead protease
MNQIKTGDLQRFFQLDRAALDQENRTVRLSFSSEEPVERWFGSEVLSHSPESVRMDRLNGGAPLLWNHDTSDQIGRVEQASIEDGRGYAVVRFSKSARAEELYQDVVDGITSNVSVGYRIHEMEQEGDKEVYRATDWQPHEISLVSVPADASVGIGRSVGEHQTRVLTQNIIKEETQMSEETKIDVQSVKDEARDQALAEERGRISTINDMAKDAPYLRELADKALTEGQPLDVFQRSALEATKQELKRKPSNDLINSPLTVDMTEKEQRSFSIVKAVQASATGDWSKAGLEREVSNAIAARVGDSNGGFYLPTDMAWGSKRDLTVGTNNQGGFLVGTDHMAASFIDALRANMVTMQAGGRMMTNLQGNVAIPKLATGTTNISFVAEGAAPSEGQPVFAQVALSGKAIAGYVQITRNLLVQSDPSVEAMIQDDITQGIATAIDAAALTGSGSSNQPTGILATTGIGSVSFSSSGAPTFSEVVAVETAIVQDNAQADNMVMVTTPAMAGALKTTVKGGSGSGRFITEDGLANGYPVLATSSMTANTVLLGDFSQLIVAQFGAIEVITDRDATTGIMNLGVHLLADIGVRRAESFSKGA